MKKLVFLSLLSVALLTSCGNGAQKDALKAQNDSLMVELSNRNAGCCGRFKPECK